MELEVGKDYHVIVINIVKSGAIVQLDDGSTALIHISRISDKFVADIRDFVQVRGEYVARGVEGSARPVELSLKHLDLRPEPVKPQVYAKQQRAENKQPKRAKVRSSKRPPSVDEMFPTLRPGSQSLEDMIQASNRAFKDKVGKDFAYQQSSKSRRSK